MEQQLSIARVNARQAIANEGTDFIVNSLVKNGVGVMHATMIGNLPESQDMIGIIQTIANAEQHAGSSFESLPISKQTEILNLSLFENSRSGQLITDRLAPPAKTSDSPLIYSSDVNLSKRENTSANIGQQPNVNIYAQRDTKGNFVYAAANVLDRGHSSVEGIIDKVGEDNAILAVMGIQLAIGGIPRTAISYVVNNLSESPKSHINSLFSNFIADKAFDINEVKDNERANKIRKVSDALGSFGIDTALGSGKDIIKGVVNSGRVTHRIGIFHQHDPNLPNVSLRGGPHSETRLPIGDGLDSHHLPADHISPIPRADGPAIQMDPRDHKKTSSNGSGLAAIAYRDRIKNLIDNGEMRKAMAIEIRDVRRAAVAGSGDLTKYNAATREMLEYAKRMQWLNK